MADHPLQPIEESSNGLISFKCNNLVKALLLAYDHNKLIAKHGSDPGFQEDHDQLLQLIGYSVSGAPLSDLTRARVELAQARPNEGKENSFSAGYESGKADALQSVRDAINEISDR
jgi:hypothetical protein